MAGVTWWTAIRIVAVGGYLVQRSGDGRTCQVLGGRVIGRSGDDVSDLYRTHRDEERGFLG
jgi:hypothetical protein